MLAFPNQDLPGPAPKMKPIISILGGFFKKQRVDSLCIVFFPGVWIFGQNSVVIKGPNADKRKQRPSIPWWFDLPSFDFYAHCSLGFLSYLPPGLPRVIPATSPSAEQRSWEGRFPPREEDNSSSTLLQRNVFEEFKISLSSHSINLCHLYYLSWFNPRSKICTKQTENYWAHKKNSERELHSLCSLSK